LYDQTSFAVTCASTARSLPLLRRRNRFCVPARFHAHVSAVLNILDLPPFLCHTRGFWFIWFTRTRTFSLRSYLWFSSLDMRLPAPPGFDLLRLPLAVSPFYLTWDARHWFCARFHAHALPHTIPLLARFTYRLPHGSPFSRATVHLNSFCCWFFSGSVVLVRDTTYHIRFAFTVCLVLLAAGRLRSHTTPFGLFHFRFIYATILVAGHHTRYAPFPPHLPLPHYTLRRSYADATRYSLRWVVDTSLHTTFPHTHHLLHAYPPHTLLRCFTPRFRRSHRHTHGWTFAPVPDIYRPAHTYPLPRLGPGFAPRTGFTWFAVRLRTGHYAHATFVLRFLLHGTTVLQFTLPFSPPRLFCSCYHVTGHAPSVFVSRTCHTFARSVHTPFFSAHTRLFRRFLPFAVGSHTLLNLMVYLATLPGSRTVLHFSVCTGLFLAVSPRRAAHFRFTRMPLLTPRTLRTRFASASHCTTLNTPPGCHVAFTMPVATSRFSRTPVWFGLTTNTASHCRYVSPGLFYLRSPLRFVRCLHHVRFV